MAQGGNKGVFDVANPYPGEMEAASYVENIANRTTMRGVVYDMTRILTVTCIVVVPLLLWATSMHPLAIIISGILGVLAVILVRDTIVVTRQLKASPLDLAFDPAPDRGPVSPANVLGVAGGVGVFGVVLLIVSTAMGDVAQGLTWGLITLGVAGVLALMSIPTFGVQARKWRVLSDALQAHPELIPYQQDARARFPHSAPFPFSAPTDQVIIP